MFAAVHLVPEIENVRFCAESTRQRLGRPPLRLIHYFAADSRSVLLAGPGYDSVSIHNNISRHQSVAAVSCQHPAERDHHADLQCGASPTQG